MKHLIKMLKLKKDRGQSLEKTALRKKLGVVVLLAVVAVSVWYINANISMVAADAFTITGNAWGYDVRPAYVIVASGDGQKLLYAQYGGYVWTSTNAGTTWTKRTSLGERDWAKAAASPDGTKLVVIEDSNVGDLYDNTGYIYTSADSGATWTARTAAGARRWRNIDISSDGTKLTALEWESSVYGAARGSYIWRSNDSGATWSQLTNAGQRVWSAVASNSTSSKLVAVGMEGLWTSTTSGATWVNRTPSLPGYTSMCVPSPYYFDSTPCFSFSDVASSADGNTIVAAGKQYYSYPAYAIGSANLYMSINSGLTWTVVGSSSSAYGWLGGNQIKISSTGTVMLTGNAVSTTTGARWSPTNFPFNPGSDYDKYIAMATSGSPIFNLRGDSGSVSTGATRGSFLDYSVNSGKTSTEKPITHGDNWTSIASSLDGTKLFATNYNEFLWTSTTSGATWVERQGASRHRWLYYSQIGGGIASSIDGSRLYVIDSFGTNGSGGYIYKSGADYGATWATSTAAGLRVWYDIAVSSSSQWVVAVPESGSMYRSADYGVTWAAVANAGTGYWGKIASSYDGTKIAADYISSDYSVQGIKVSTTSGSTWVLRVPDPTDTYIDWMSIAMSSDGARMAALGSNGYVYTSSSTGATWTKRSNVNAGNSVSSGHITMSPNGAKLAAGANSYLYTSPDYGLTWTANTSVGERQWKTVVSAATGTKLYATGNTWYGAYTPVYDVAWDTTNAQLYGGSGGDSGNTIFAATEQNDSCSWVGYYHPVLSISYPAASSTFAAGSSFIIQGTYAYHTSDAVPASSTIKWINHDGTQSGTKALASSTATCSGGGCPNGTTSPFFTLAALGTPNTSAITVPSVGGTYRFWLFATSTSACTTDTASGYMDYYVSQTATCGTMSGQTFNDTTNQPSGTACGVGTASSITPSGASEGVHTWQCAGINNGTSSPTCSYTQHIHVDGRCPTTTTYAPSCAYGSYSGYATTTGGNSSWTCNGIYNGANPLCTYTAPTSGILNIILKLTSSNAPTVSNSCNATWSVTSTTQAPISCLFTDASSTVSVATSSTGYTTRGPGVKKLTCTQGTSVASSSVRCIKNSGYIEQ